MGSPLVRIKVDEARKALSTVPVMNNCPVSGSWLLGFLAPGSPRAGSTHYMASISSSSVFFTDIGESTDWPWQGLIAHFRSQKGELNRAAY